MDMAQKITSMVLALRRKVNIKVRQPLAQIMVPAIDEEQRRLAVFGERRFVIGHA